MFRFQQHLSLIIFLTNKLETPLIPFKEYKILLSKTLNLVTVARVCREKGFDRMLHLAKCLKKANLLKENVD